MHTATNSLGFSLALAAPFTNTLVLGQGNPPDIAARSAAVFNHVYLVAHQDSVGGLVEALHQPGGPDEKIIGRFAVGQVQVQQVLALVREGFHQAGPRPVGIPDHKAVALQLIGQHFFGVEKQP